MIIQLWEADIGKAMSEEYERRKDDPDFPKGGFSGSPSDFVVTLATDEGCPIASFHFIKYEYAKTKFDTLVSEYTNIGASNGIWEPDAVSLYKKKISTYHERNKK